MYRAQIYEHRIIIAVCDPPSHCIQPERHFKTQPNQGISVSSKLFPLLELLEPLLL